MGFFPPQLLAFLFLFCDDDGWLAPVVLAHTISLSLALSFTVA